MSQGVSLEGCSGLDANDGERQVSVGTVSKVAVGMSGRHEQLMGHVEMVMVIK